MLFGEDQGLFLLAVTKTQINGFTNKYAPLQLLGEFGGDDVSIEVGGQTHSVALSRLREAHEGWLPNYMDAVD